MTKTPSTPDLLLDYDDTRGRINKTLLRLVDVLPRVDGLDPATLDQARDALFHSDHPFLLVFVGQFGSGKSSLINALLGQDVLPTGPIPTTDRIIILRQGAAVDSARGADDVETLFHPARLLRSVSLVDTPGLESVYKEHGEKTDKFLHRSDLVVLVMLSTQALSASNLRYLAGLREYGKRAIVVVNQVDLLDNDQRETVRAFVREQCMTHLQAEPAIFLVSSRQGIEARGQYPPDEAGWQASGMAALEAYLTETIDDRERLRQKLQTPLQITRHVLSSAQRQVQTQQAALDRYRTAAENIAAQVKAARYENQKIVDETNKEIDAMFAQTAVRGEETIRELFMPTRALSQVTTGLTELLGLARLFRRMGRRSQATRAIETAEVMEPLDDVGKTFGQLGPRLEGRDLQDTDNLVNYTRRAIDDLPPTLQSKLIGEVRGPVSYDREPLRAARDALDKIVEDARALEPARLDRAVRNTLIFLAGWQLAIVLVLCIVSLGGLQTEDASGPLLVVIGGLVLMLAGILLMPLRGLWLARQYSNRMMAASEQYQAVVREAAAEQIEYGVKLREDVAGPFTRLLAAQHNLHAELGAELRGFDEELSALSGEVGALWK